MVPRQWRPFGRLFICQKENKTMKTSLEIRQQFLDYFKEQGHMVEEGHSLIPHNDPTLLWINSGVAALKKYFDGSTKPSNNRIVNVQKAIRTNDIENVGKTARHHTFFEMLGNFSIGDYFKKEAIHFGWDFLTSPKWMNLEKDRLYITVHPDDSEAYDIWVNEIGVDPRKILKTEENYWQIGEGPSGPNTEIMYDRGPSYDPDNIGEKLFFEDLDNDRYVELWNIVFSQYDAKEGVERKDFKELPQKNIDTGMGFERLVCILQDGETNFDTDLFLPIINHVQKLAKVTYKENPMAYRVIADHVRTITFALTDGALFSNEGRGYVLRRIIRRAIRFGIQIGIEGQFMSSLVDDVVEIMSGFYPQLNDSKTLVKKLIDLEEKRFHLTLADGEKMLSEALTTTNILSGADAFKLYDTYGFPLEMTLEIAQEQEKSVDVDGFNEHMQRQKEMSRSARVDSESMGSQSEALMNFEKPSVFIGYEFEKNVSKIIGLFAQGQAVSKITTTGQIIVDSTVFYAESGGQVGDTGTIISKTGKAIVKNVTKAPHNQALHHIVMEEGYLSLDDQVTLEINHKNRELIRRNHSSVHLLQNALIDIVGAHIHQAGSFVSDEYSRFDFSHFEKIDHETLNQIEQRVNEMILQNSPVITEIMSMDDAKQSGAIALFDEKYGDVVRVVSMGASKELCGGTHVANTSQIGVYKIVSEESIGSGIRRIVAKTSQGAYEDFKAQERHLESIASELKATSILKIDEKLAQLKNENTSQALQIEKLHDQLIDGEATKLSLENNAIIFKSSLDGQLGKKLVEKLRNNHPESLIFGAFVNEEKQSINFICAVGKPLINKGLKAGDLVKEAAKIAGGGGGGRPDFAQAGGKDLSKIDDVLSFIHSKQ